MPLFEFSCLDCGIEFESLVMKNSEISEVACPSCRGKRLEEKVSSFASISSGGASVAANCTPSGG